MAQQPQTPGTTLPRPRWVLHIQAQFWRTLMAIGMTLHRLAPPRPPRPSFTRTISAVVSGRTGQFTLQFYVPRSYETHRRLGSHKYPVLVNFHGGGFTLGTGTDDARWCATVVEEVQAVVVSVDYRRAPEYPFPTAVEDGVDSVLWLAQHAEELALDVDRMAISGFSSGGNMALTVPLRLQEELERQFDEGVGGVSADAAGTSESSLSRPLLQRAVSKGRMLVKAKKEISIVAVVPWYPSTDYTRTREQRRQTCSRKDQELPAVFTELFDESYLQPPTMDKSNPYLSPGVAPNEMLYGLPDDIIMFTCEWDMLLAEGERLKDRLLEIGKNVVYTKVPGVPHGWDKAPNPLRPTPGVQKYYLQACRELRRVFRIPENMLESRRRSTIVR